MSYKQVTVGKLVCDRCGHEVSLPEDSVEEGDDAMQKAGFALVSMNRGEEDEEEWDLCPECKEALKRFMKEKEQ